MTLTPRRSRLRRAPPPLAPGSRSPASDEAAEDGGPDPLAAFQAGDHEAFQELVGSYGERLIHFFYRLCWDRDRAEDFTQDLFMRLLRGAANYRPEGRLSTFIYRVATNLWIDHYRSARPMPRLYSLDQPLLDGGPTLASNAAAEVQDPADAAMGDEEKERLRGALDALNEPHRLVLELAVYQELPYAEIGAILDIPVGTVKSRMHNTVRALRERLAPPLPEAGHAGFRSAGGAG